MTELPFPIHTRETPQESQAILDRNKIKFSRQAKQVFDLLMSGERLTTATAITKYGIMDARTRVSDLRKAKVKFHTELLEGRFKVYFMTDEDRRENTSLNL